MQGVHYFWGVLLAAKIENIEKQTKHHIDWGTIANARLPGWVFCWQLDWWRSWCTSYSSAAC